MKRLLLLISLYGCLCADAQDIPNAGFENWTSFNNYEDPNGWETLNDRTSIIGIITATKATGPDAHTGNALMLKTQHIAFANITAPGIAVTGHINDQTSTLEGGIPYTLRPGRFNGWFKYAPVENDSAVFGLVLFKWNSITHQRDTVGAGMLMKTEPVTVYSQFSVVIQYLSNETPDSALFVLTASGGSNPKDGSTLFVDDLTVDFPTGINSTHISQKVFTYPNPAKNELFFENLSGQKITITIFDGMGNKIDEVVSDKSIYSQQLTTYSSGLYIYQIHDMGKNYVESGKFLISK